MQKKLIVFLFIKEHHFVFLGLSLLIVIPIWSYFSMKLTALLKGGHLKDIQIKIIRI